MKTIAIIILVCFGCYLAKNSATYRYSFARAFGTIIGAAFALWLWHAAGLWPFK